MNAPAQPIPDSAARQLILENNLAHDTPPLPIGSASSPIRPPSGYQLPVWNSAHPIRFSPTPGGYTPNGAPQAHLTHWTNDDTNAVQAGNGNPIGTSNSKPDTKPPIGTREASIWDVPVTPRHHDTIS